MNPGEVWEENELWIDLSWRIDPGRRARDPQALRVEARAGQQAHASTSTTASSSRTPCRACPSSAQRRGPDAARVHAPLRRLRDREQGRRAAHGPRTRRPSSWTCARGARAASTREARSPRLANLVPVPVARPRRRRPASRSGSRSTARSCAASRRRAGGSSSTRRRSRPGAGPSTRCPAYIRSHVHPQSLEQGEVPLIPTFRLPVQIHTRSANAKWLDEIAHTNPLWIHPTHAAQLGVATGDLVRVETRIGYFVVKAWVTEGIRPGVVACSHHMGRWKLEGPGQRQLMATVSLRQEGTRWRPAPRARRRAVRLGRPRHLAHLVDRRGRPPEPDLPGAAGPGLGHALLAPGRARAGRAEPGDRPRRRLGRHREVARGVREWLARTRPAAQHSPDGTRRPYWLLRPLKPGRDVYKLPAPDRP